MGGNAQEEFLVFSAGNPGLTLVSLCQYNTSQISELCN